MNYSTEILQPSTRLEEWDMFVDRSPQGTLFCKSWWLRAVCKERFEILVIKQNGEIIAGLPITYEIAWGKKIIRPPELSTAMGVLLAPNEKGTYEKNLSREMDLLSAVAENIPVNNGFMILCHPSITNWLPFYWNGYSQTTNYTYVLEDIEDAEKAISEFTYAKKKNIKKASGMVTVMEDLSSRELFTHYVRTLKKQQKTIFYPYDYFRDLYDAAYSRKAGKSWYAVDNDGNIHSVFFVVFDERSAYCLISAIDPDFRNSGAHTLLVREAITHASKITRRFDFAGSMMKGVENSNRKFGAVQKTFFCISKGGGLQSGIKKLTDRLLRKYGLKA